jgi:hypothetical protein
MPAAQHSVGSALSLDPTYAVAFCGSLLPRKTLYDRRIADLSRKRLMTAFDPSAFGFRMLQGFEFPGGVAVYEYANHASVDGKADFLRINAYLGKDGDYVTIWRGLLEPLFAESSLGFVQIPDGFDFHESFTEELFKGWIDTAEAANHILEALRLGNTPPQVLGTGPDGKLQCDVL